MMTYNGKCNIGLTGLTWSWLWHSIHWQNIGYTGLTWSQRFYLLYSHICYTGLTGSQPWQLVYSYICYTGLTGSQLWHFLTADWVTYLHICYTGLTWSQLWQSSYSMEFNSFTFIGNYPCDLVNLVWLRVNPLSWYSILWAAPSSPTLYRGSALSMQFLTLPDFGDATAIAHDRNCLQQCDFNFLACVELQGAFPFHRDWDGALFFSTGFPGWQLVFSNCPQPFLHWGTMQRWFIFCMEVATLGPTSQLWPHHTVWLQLLYISFIFYDTMSYQVCIWCFGIFTLVIPGCILISLMTIPTALPFLFGIGNDVFPLFFFSLQTLVWRIFIWPAAAGLTFV